MPDPVWPFDQPRNCAVITLRAILIRGEPVLRVSHDEDDHGWQFYGYGDADVADAAVVALSEMIDIDPCVRQIADLPPGWRAWRSSTSAPWQRGPTLPAAE